MISIFMGLNIAWYLLNVKREVRRKVIVFSIVDKSCIRWQNSGILISKKTYIINRRANLMKVRDAKLSV